MSNDNFVLIRKVVNGIEPEPEYLHSTILSREEVVKLFDDGVVGLSQALVVLPESLEDWPADKFLLIEINPFNPLGLIMPLFGTMFG